MTNVIEATDSARTAESGTPGAIGVRPGGGLPRTAAVIAASAWLLAVGSTVLLLAARPPISELLWFFTVDATVAAVYGTVAGLTLSRRRHAVPWLVALMAIGCGVSALASAYSTFGARHALPGADVALNLISVGWVPGTLAIFLVVPWLVRDHPLGPVALTGLTLGSAVSVAFFGVNLTQPESPLPTTALAVAAVGIGLLAAAEVTWRRFRGPVRERIGLGWLAAGTAIMALSFVPLAFYGFVALPIWFTPVLHLVAQAVFPAAILVAVLRQRMWGLDLAISRAVLGGLLTVGLVVLYTVVTALLTRLLPGDGAPQIVAAAVVAVAVQPSRLWLQRHVRRLVYGDAAEPERAVRRLGRHLGGAQSAEELLDGLVESVGHALRLESVTLDVDGVRAAAWGSPTSSPLVVPLRHRGAEVGELGVTAPPGEALDARALRSLDELVSVVAAGVVLARASQDLADARQRLTSARLEERRVIRRELHDGLGPSLAGIRLGLQGARNLISRDPQAAGTLLAALQEELDGRVHDVRTLSHNLLPPILDELGLEPALRELAARHAQGGLDVQIHCDGLDGLDGLRPGAGPGGLRSGEGTVGLRPGDGPGGLRPREDTGGLRPGEGTRGLPPGEGADSGVGAAAAAYGIVVEAVMNVARHAEASTCTVSVTTDGRAVRIVVEDDGSGFRPGAVPGVGTRSMRERAEEQGGTLAMTPAATGGTRVTAVLPT